MGGRGAHSSIRATKVPQKTATPSGKTLADVQAMDDDGMHDFLIDVENTDTPDFLNTHHLQKMIYALGLNDKPEIISQQEFDDQTVNAPFGSNKPILYRTVDDAPLSGGVTLTAKQIQDMTLYGDLTYVGNGIHGDGIYFADNKAASQAYGYGGGKSRTIACVLNDKARPITEKKLSAEYNQFIKVHPRTRRALGFAKTHSSHDSLSQFALLRGYNVIVSNNYSSNYYTVLDRSVLSTTGKVEKY